MNKDNETLESIAELEGQARKTGQELHTGTIYCFRGPCFETRRISFREPSALLCLGCMGQHI